MPNTVSRTQVTLTWNSRRSSSGQSISTSGGRTYFNLPLAEIIRREVPEGSRTPSSGQLFEREGFPSILVVGELADSDVNSAILSYLAYFVENAGALGLDDPLLTETRVGTDLSLGGSISQQNETIVIYLADYGVPGKVGEYQDLDLQSEVVGFVDSVNSLFSSWGKQDSNADFDFITSYDQRVTESRQEAFYRIKTLIHEIFHREFGHDYDTRFRSYSDNPTAFAQPYTIQQALEDPVYSKTRVSMLALYEAGLVTHAGKRHGENGAFDSSQFAQFLLDEDRAKLKSVVDEAEILRIGILLREGSANDWAGLAIEDLRRLTDEGVLKIDPDNDPNDRSSYRAGSLPPEIQTLEKYYAWMLGIYHEGVSLEGLAPTHIRELQRLARDQEAQACFAYAGLAYPHCGSMREAFRAATFATQDSMSISLNSDGVLRVRHPDAADGEFSQGALIGYSNGMVTSFTIGVDDILDQVDDATRDLLIEVGTYVLKLGGEAVLNGTIGETIAPVFFAYRTRDDGSIETTLHVDLAAFDRGNGLRATFTPRGDGVIKKTIIRNGVIELIEEFKDFTITRTDESGITSVRFKDSAVGFDFVDAGELLGSALGYRLAGGNELVGVVTSAALKTVGSNLGDLLNDALFTKESQRESLAKILEGFDSELIANLRTSGLGAISAFLTAELITALGVNGFAGGALNTGAGAVIGHVLTNIADFGDVFGTQIPGADPGELYGPLNGVDLTLVGNAIGSFLGTKLASELVTFDTIGGQIGASVGSSLGSIAAGKLLGDTFGFLGAAGGPVGVAIGAFVGYLLGGVIGSIFGGTPRSGADAVWDAAQGRFVTSNVYSKKGGSKGTAQAMATSVAQTFNLVLDATGGRLENPRAITSGNYGMRKSDFVYRPTSTREKDAITYRVSSKQDGAFEKLTGYGIWQGLTDPDFQIIGGSNYVKRAVYATFETGGMSATNFDQSVLLGNISSAQSYESYLANSGVINAIVSGEPDSVFAAETAINLVRAVELGLTKRHRADWFGGFNALADEASTNAASFEFGFDYDPFSDKVSRLIGVGDFVMGDSIDVAGQTTIEAGDGDDVITLTHQSQQITRGGNLIDMSGWPDTDAALPTGDAEVTGWKANPYDDETQWALTTGPDGRKEVTLHAGQEDTDASGGGGKTNEFAIDGTKSYEFTQYFRKDVNNLGHRVLFGLNNVASGTDSYVLSASNGSDQTNPYFYGATAAAQDALFEDGKWYKVTGYVLAEGSADVPSGTLGGIFDLESGEKVADVDAFRWNSNRPDDDVYSRFFTYDGVTNLENSVHFMAPEVREVLTADIAGGADMIADTNDLIINGLAGDGHAMTVDVAATIDAGAGNDVVHAGDLGNNVFGGEGNDTIYGGRLDDWLLGGEGNDLLDAGSAAAGSLGGDGNYLNGGDGDDTLQGREGSDWLEGGEGVDTLSGSGGGDVLSGGGGEGDQLHGGAGDDSYLLRLGDGADVVDDIDPGALFEAPEHAASIAAISGAWLLSAATDQYAIAAGLGATSYIQARFAGMADGSIKADWTGQFTPGVSTKGLGGGEDSLVLGQGIEIGDVRLLRSGTSGAQGNDLIVQIMTVDANGDAVVSGDQMTLTNWFSNPFQRIEWLKFTDGNEIRISDITSFVVGTNGNDTLVGTLGNDFLYGGGGNDRLFLLAGDDIGSGGSGMDYVAGDSGNDLIVGGSDRDALTGGAGKDVITGDGGDDDIYGGDGNDIIAGGLGNDHLVGGGGDDVFRYSRGDGADTIFDEFAGTWETVWERTSTSNGSFANGYTLQANGEIVDTNGAVVRANVGTVEDPQFQWVGRWDFSSADEILRRYVEPTSGPEVADSDGTQSWRWDNAAGSYTSGASLGDLIEFSAGINIQDVVLRQTGNDLTMHISGDGGESGIVPQGGDSITLKDWSVAAGNIERLAFYATGELDLTQTDLIAGTDGADTLVGGSGADWATGGTGEDDIRGNGGDDILSGNGGIDTIRGGAGDDVLFGGSGNDVLIGGSNSYASGAQGDVLIGGAGSDWASYEDQTAAVIVSLGEPQINTGVATNDNFYSIENLRGGAGADRLIGDEYDNILEGGKGDDTLEGGEGDDTYVWNAVSASSNDGAITIREGGAGLTEVFDQNGVIQDGYTSTVNNVGDPFAPSSAYEYLIQVVEDQTNTTVYFELTDPDNKPKDFTSPSTWPASGWLHGFEPTGLGDQVARIDIDSSVDAGEDTLLLGEGITFADLSFIKDNSDLIIRYGDDSASQITIEGHYTVGGKVETLLFHDGLSANLSQLKLGADGNGQDNLIVGDGTANTLNGNGGDDVIFGGGGGDTLHGQGGDDTIEGGQGADILDGGSHSSNGGDNPLWGDTVRYQSSSTGTVRVDFRKQISGEAQIGGDAEGDILSGFENYVGSDNNRDVFRGDDNANRVFGLGGNDTLYGFAGDDVLVGGKGEDNLYGGEGEDNLSGGEDADSLDGGTHDDALDGGEGTDSLYGGSGNDYLFGGAGDDSGTEGATVYGLFGGTGDDIIDGGVGNDDLFGEDGNDTLIGGLGDDNLDGGAGDDVYYFASNDGHDTLTDTSGVNHIVMGFGANDDGSPVFDNAISPASLWLTRHGDDLKVEEIGKPSSLTVTNFFAAAGNTLIETVRTASGTLFLNDPEVLQFITDMTATDLIDDDGWPGDVGNVTTGSAQVSGWGTSFVAEATWDGTTPGPYGSEIVSLRSTQSDPASSGAGGAYTNAFAIDGTKTYEFTYYFRRDDGPGQGVLLGLKNVSSTSAAYVELADSDPAGAGNESTNPYFYAANGVTQENLFSGDGWYKAVGYVFGEGTDTVTAGEYGGIYDTITGEKVAELQNFRWSEGRADDIVFSRMFGWDGTTNPAHAANFYKPQVREVTDLSYLMQAGDRLNVQLDSALTSAPPVMPEDLAAQIDRIWAPNDTPAPRAPIEVQTVEILTLSANAFNLDQWPDLPPTGKSETNLVDENGWPGDVDSLPNGPAQIAGWSAYFAEESVWDGATPGPYGIEVVSVQATQSDTSDDHAGGASTNVFDIDGTKAYEFTYYFRRDDGPGQRVLFGLSNVNASSDGYVELANSDPAATGNESTNPYFYGANAAEQESLFSGDRWYKVVGYVFEEGADAVSTGEFGGIFDTVTGERVAEVQNFRWSEGRSDDTVFSRMFGWQGTGNPGHTTNFYRPEVREILDGSSSPYITRGNDELNLFTDSLFINGAEVEGFRNQGQYALDGEARWSRVEGPDGSALTVVEAGQFDDIAAGGGNVTNELTVDTTKIYRYVQYFRKTDLDMHSTYAGVQAWGDTGDGKENLATGNAADGGYFLNSTVQNQMDHLVEDEWYMVVGYVLPEGTPVDATAQYGGVYNAETGNRIDGVQVNTYRWAANSNEVTARGRYFTFHDELNHGWSTQFGAPSFGTIPNDELAAYNSDPFGLTNPQLGEAVTIDASLGVTDFDDDITGWSLNPDGGPSKGELISIDSATGSVVYRPYADAIGEDSFSVVVTDAENNQTVIPVNVNLTLANVNMAPVLPTQGYEFTIDENSVIGAIAGTLTSTDPDGPSSMDYMFRNSLMTMAGGSFVTFSDDDRFRIERDTGKVILNEGTLDYEAGDDFAYDVRVTDLNSGFNSRASYAGLSISVGDVNEAHSVIDAAIDVNHYSRALGPFVPMPDADGIAINLSDTMLVDVENSYVTWSITSVKRNGTTTATHPWSIDADGSLHLDGAIAANESWALTVSADDPDLTGSAVSATLTLNVGADDGFLVNPVFTGSGIPGWKIPNSYLPPVVLDLDGDGVELVSFSASTAKFDMDGDGNRDRTGWVGADDGLLFIDLNDNGIVDDGSEISFQRFVDGAFSDLEGLAFFDTNLDGILSAGDTQFADFGVWRDTNQDGVSDAGEIFTLPELGIVSVSLSGTKTGDSPGSSENVVYATGSYGNADGSLGELADTFLVFDPLSYLDESDIPAPDDGGDTGSGGSGGGEPLVLPVAVQNFDRKSKKYGAYAVNGQLVIGPRNMDSMFDPRAGAITGVTVMHFSNRTRGYLTPIILDLDGDGIEMRKRKKADAWFDMDGDGSRDDVGWTGRGDGFLVIDRNGNGLIDDGSELAFGAENPDATSNIQALASLDSNGDGRLSADDARFNELKVWVDANGNGRTDTGELRTLDQHGIVSIGLSAQFNDDAVKIGTNILLATTIFERSNGTAGTVGDVALAFKPGSSSPRSTLGVDASGSASSNAYLRKFGFEGAPWYSLAIEEQEFMASLGSVSSTNPTSADADLEAMMAGNPFETFAPSDEEANEISQTQIYETVKLNVTDNPDFSDVIANATTSAGLARRLALISQDMNTFGATPAADLLERRPDEHARSLDYFAA